MIRALLLLALALVGCATTIDPSQAIADAKIIVSGLTTDAQALVGLYPGALSPAQQAAVTADLAAANAALDAVTLSPLLTLRTVADDVNAVVAVLSDACKAGPCPSEVSAGLLAANVLLPLIEAQIAQLQGGTVVPKAAKQAMTPEQARRTLRDAR